MQGMSNTSGRMRNPSMVGRSIFHNHSSAMGPASLPPCSPVRVVRMLLSPSTTGDTNWSQDTVLIPGFFPGLSCGRKTELAGILRGTKEQEFAALSLVPAQCRWGLPTLAKWDVCSTRPCLVPSRQSRAFRRNMIYSSIRCLPNGHRSKMSAKRRTPSSCEGIEMRKSSFNAGSDALRPTAANHESRGKRGSSDRHLPVLDT